MTRLFLWFRAVAQVWDLRQQVAKLTAEGDRWAEKAMVLTAELDKERERNNQLTLDIVEMRLETIKLHQVVTTPPPGPDEQARRDWAVIEDALDSVGLAGAARRQQVDWAERMLRRGTKAAEVAELVRRGADDDGA